MSVNNNPKNSIAKLLNDIKLAKIAAQTKPAHVAQNTEVTVWLGQFGQKLRSAQSEQSLGLL